MVNIMIFLLYSLNAQEEREIQWCEQLHLHEFHQKLIGKHAQCLKVNASLWSNASFYNTVNSSLKNTLVESISFRNEEDSHFKSSAKNKENMREKNTESKGKFSHHISIDKNSMPIKRLSFDKKDRLYEELGKNPKKIQIDLSASIQ